MTTTKSKPVISFSPSALKISKQLKEQKFKYNQHELKWFDKFQDQVIILNLAGLLKKSEYNRICKILTSQIHAHAKDNSIIRYAINKAPMKLK